MAVDYSLLFKAGSAPNPMESALQQAGQFHQIAQQDAKTQRDLAMVARERQALGEVYKNINDPDAVLALTQQFPDLAPKIQQAVQGYGQMLQQTEDNQFVQDFKAATAAAEAGDLEAMNALTARYPHRRTQVLQAMNLESDAKQTAMGTLASQLSNAAGAGDAATAERLIDQHSTFLRTLGPMYDPDVLKAQLKENPSAFAQRAQSFSVLSLGTETRVKHQLEEKKEAGLETRSQRDYDIRRLEAGIKAKEHAIAMEGNLLKQQQMLLDLQKDQRELRNKQAEVIAADEQSLLRLDETYALASELANDPNLNNAVGSAAFLKVSPTIRQGSSDLIVKAQRLQNMLTADNLKLMSGVLTDKDIQVIASVASSIKVDENGIVGSEKEVRKQLNEISAKIKESMDRKRREISTRRGSSSQLSDDELLKLYGG